MTIEIRISQTETKSEAAYLQKILGSVDHSKSKNLSEILREFSAEKDSTNAHEQSSVNEQKSAVNFEKEDKKAEEKDFEIREYKIEIFNQERGR